MAHVAIEVLERAKKARLEMDIFSLVSADIFLPLAAAESFALVSSVSGLPFKATDFFLRVSSEGGPRSFRKGYFLPFWANEILRLVSSLALMPRRDPATLHLLYSG